MVSFKTAVSLMVIGLSFAQAAVIQKRAFAFQEYSKFQISDGIAGDAQAKAEAIFVTPFKGQDLSKVSEADLENVAKMSKAAVDAEAQFDAAIAKATGADAQAFTNGKIANKVVKLQSDLQRLLIKQAQGDTTGAAAIEEQQTKLANNIKLDQAAKGQPQKSIF